LANLSHSLEISAFLLWFVSPYHKLLMPSLLLYSCQTITSSMTRRVAIQYSNRHTLSWWNRNKLIKLDRIYSERCSSDEASSICRAYTVLKLRFCMFVLHNHLRHWRYTFPDCFYILLCVPDTTRYVQSIARCVFKCVII